MKTILMCLGGWLAACSLASAADDIVIADFESDTYGDWKTTGDAFGTGPAHGAFPNQHPVAGYEGKGLVNSMLNGDDATGSLTSPEFTIERKYINFLIGGGTGCINLLVDGKVVRTAMGPNDEHLDWETWDVSEWSGKKASIQILDNVVGGWGHINIDQIVMSDTFKLEPGKPEKLYDERYRPQFHFSPKINWTNDPNGMVYYQGEYHLFFQHNPTGINWGNMTWGHAVGRDMVHWTQLDNAILPDAMGTIFSGSAVVDWNNTSGFQTGKEKPIVCIYTSAGGTSPESKGQPFTQSLAYSNDRGRTWIKYDKNPVLEHIAGGNRDPKVLWHAPSKQWVMALYLDKPDAKHDYALFGSPNLKEWAKLCDVPLVGDTECPDFFELPVDGNSKNTKWVFWGAANKYLIGSFDGKTFQAEAGPFPSHWGKNRYAAQTFSDIPSSDGRRIQIAWMAGGKYPRMPFNQQFSFPTTLTLRTFADGVRLCTLPIKEIDKLHQKLYRWKGQLKPDANPLSKIRGDAFDIRLNIKPGAAKEIGLKIRGVPIRYNVQEKTLTCMDASAPVELADGSLAIQVLVDRSSIEIFTVDGRVNMAYCFNPPTDDKSLAIFAQDGTADVQSVDVWHLKSIWPQ